MTITRLATLRLGVLGLTCCCVLAGHTALAQAPAPQKAARETLTIDLTKVAKPWTGDLDDDRWRAIRVLDRL
jgi:hypothetical protein